MRTNFVEAGFGLSRICLDRFIISAGICESGIHQDSWLSECDNESGVTGRHPNSKNSLLSSSGSGPFTRRSHHAISVRSKTLFVPRIRYEESLERREAGVEGRFAPGEGTAGPAWQCENAKKTGGSIRRSFQFCTRSQVLLFQPRASGGLFFPAQSDT